MADQILLPRLLDTNGDPVSGGKVNVYETGTATPVTTYQEIGLSTPHANPQVADSDGYFAQAFYDGAVAVKLVFTTAADVTLYTLDPGLTDSTSAASAAGITFVPTTDIAQSDVQNAIEQVQTNIVDATLNATSLVATGGTGAAFTLSSPQTITAYADGQMFNVRWHTTASASPTLAVDGLAALNIRMFNTAGTLVGVHANGMRAGATATLYCDGTQFIVVSPVGYGSSGVYGTTIVLDEDDFASDHATHTASQQSVKAYVDGTAAAATALSSGTESDRTVTTAANRIVVRFDGVSQDSAAQTLLLQLGDGGGVDVSGYKSGCSTDAGADYRTDGINLTRNGVLIAAETLTGFIELRHFGSNQWVASGSLLVATGADELGTVYGELTLSTALTTLRLTTVGGTAEFDAGEWGHTEFYH